MSPVTAFRALLVLALALLPGGATASVADEARSEQLAIWQEMPVDLATADVAEISLLPGLDADLAASVVGLRDVEGLQRIEDLLRVPGIGRAELDALRPYATVGSRALPFGVEIGSVGQRHGAVERWRQSGRVSLGDARAAFVTSGAPQRIQRAALSIPVSTSLSLAGGDLVLAGPGGLLDPGGGRSRVAMAPLPRAPRVRERTDSSPDPGWRGAALVHLQGTFLLFVGHGPGGAPVTGASTLLQGEAFRIGLATRLGAEQPAFAAHLLREEGRSVAWVEGVAERRARSGRFGTRILGQGWRVGMDAGATDGRLAHGSDPVTGHRLDRRQQSIQVHGRVRGSGWSAGVLAREMRRGEVSREWNATTVDLDLAWRPRRRSGPRRVAVNVRAAPLRRITVSSRFEARDNELRLRYSHETDGLAAAELFGAELLRRRAESTATIAVAGADGRGSRVWMLRRPGTGIHPLWLRPSERLLSVGWRKDGRHIRVGLWGWARGGGSRPAEVGFGISCGFRTGRLVQRLLEPSRGTAPIRGPAQSGAGDP